MILLALALQAAPAAAVTEAGDWLAWCTPQGCAAELAPAAGPGPLRLSLMPAPSRRRPPALAITLPPGVAKGATVRLLADGVAVASMVAPGGGGGLALPLDARLGPALRRARVLTVEDAAARVLGTASLVGLGAALTAIAAVPPAPPAPIRALPRPEKRPRTLSTKQAAKLIPAQPCLADAPGVVRAVRLDPAQSLALVAAPCGDDYILRPLLIDERGRTRLAEIDDVGAVERADWEAGAHRLVLAEPRGEGRRCAAERRYAWNGARFVPAEVSYRCAGRAAPIVTWAAPLL